MFISAWLKNKTKLFKQLQNDVIEVKNIVDEIINSILNLMNQDTKEQTEKYILKDPLIRCIVTETEDIILDTKDEDLLKTVIKSS